MCWLHSKRCIQFSKILMKIMIVATWSYFFWWNLIKKNTSCQWELGWILNIFNTVFEIHHENLDNELDHIYNFIGGTSLKCCGWEFGWILKMIKNPSHEMGIKCWTTLFSVAMLGFPVLRPKCKTNSNGPCFARKMVNRMVVTKASILGCGPCRAGYI